MKKCKKCGSELIGKVCPNGCKQNNAKKGCAVIAIIFVILFTVIIVAALSPSDTTTDGKTSNIQSSNSDTSNVYETEKDLITFEGVEAKFVKLYDPKAGVTALAIALDLKNNGSEEITVTLAESYVNDTKVQFMTGLPVTIAPGKKAVGVYMFGYDGLGFSKVEDIEKMEFKVSLINESWSGLKTSEKIELNFK